MNVNFSSNESCSNSPISCMNRSHGSVSFGVVRVREFERIVGDHPCVSDCGPPLSIGWAYYDDGVEIPVDDFKMTHGPYLLNNSIGGLKPLRFQVRRVILQEYFQVSSYEIREAQREVARTRKQRYETLQNQGKLKEKLQDALQTAKHCLRRRTREIAPLYSKRRIAQPIFAGFA